MTHFQQERETAEPITAVVASRVRELRTRAGMSQVALAERMSQLGIPWTRLTVVNLEKRGTATRGSGPGRDAVTVGELMALAVALEVPLIWLLADPKAGTPVPLTEAVELDPWFALMWMIGRQVVGAPTGTNWKNQEFDLLLKVERLWEALMSLDMYLHRWKTLSEKHHAAIEEVVREDLDQVRWCLQGMADAGAPLPQLPPDVRKRATELGIELPGQENLSNGSR